MRRTAVMLALTALAAGGCGAGHVRTSTATHPGSTASNPSKLAQAQATHEYPSPPPKPQTAKSPSTTAAAAIRAFATAYINWDAQSVAGDMLSLAARSVGQARAAMTLAAAETASDYELQRGGIANHGTVEAVAPLAHRQDQYVVVTLESTSATNTTAYQGLQPAWHIAVATVTEQATGRWVLTGWQPEN